MLKYKLSAEKVLTTVIGLLLISIVIVIAISYFQSRQVRQANRLVATTQDVLMHSEKVLTLLVDIETGQRGYVLTGQSKFLEPYHNAQKNIYAELAYLKKLVSNNPEQLRRADTLAYYTDKKIEYVNALLRLYDHKGQQAAQSVVETGEGKYYSDIIRAQVNKIQAEENAQLARQKEYGEQRTITLNGILLAVVIIILVLLGLFVQKVRIDFTQRKNAATALQQLNNELELRVKERTAELEHSKQILEETFSRITDAFMALDNNHCFTYLNAKASEMLQRSPDMLIGKNAKTIFPERIDSPGFQTYLRAVEQQQYMWYEDYYAPFDFWYETHVYPSPVGTSIYVRNITERKRAEQKINKLNRLYFFISQVNQMIVRTSDEVTLFKEACNIAVTIGQFRFAWIGMLDTHTGTVQVAQQAGIGKAYLVDSIVGTFNRLAQMKPKNDSGLPWSSYIICNDIKLDRELEQWADEAIAAGYLSYMVLPIRRFGKTIGVFAYYAGEKNFFDKAETALLEEATGDVSFALENFEKDKQRRLAEEATERERYISDSIINSLPGVFYLYNKEGRFLRWNKNFETVTGYSTEDMKLAHPLHFFEGDDKKLLEAKIANVFTEGEDSVQASFYTKSKTKLPYFFTGKAVEYNGEECLMGVGIDLSNLVKTQRELQETTEKLHHLTAHLQDVREEERKRIGREIHDELGQQLTAIKMDTSWIEKKLPEDLPQLKEKLKGIIALLDSSNQSIRRILSELRPIALDDNGLMEALTWLGSQFTAKTGIPVNCSLPSAKLKLPEAVNTCMYRVCQEALTNVARYANASTVDIALAMVDGAVSLVVEDDGRGFDMAAISSKSFGILGMKERVFSLNGQFRIDTAPGKGTIITLSIPIK
ncbi:MAG TPA: CHASE3 domain-containing protein [Ferruginibacter sp.]|nr:CHASE3 domain-containing protein [Ferruginibacter sp.]HMP21910.1 CHASE3 domain-containing protein [Ferruginibacter sp.]